MAGLLWVFMLDFPLDADVGFEMSWRMVLDWASRQPLAFGRDFVFSYGPLGYLLTRAYAGTALWDFVIFQALLSALVAWLALAAFRDLSWPRAIGLAILMAAVAWGETLVVILLLMLMGLTVQTGVRTTWQALGLAGVCGVVALMRPTGLALGALVVGGAALSTALAGRRRLALALAGGLVATYLVGWMAAGQRLGDVLVFLDRSSLYARGNLESMALEEAPATFYLGAAALALILAGSALAGAGRASAGSPVVAGLVLCGFAFAKWKHGFVRADIHVNQFFLFAIAAALMHPLLVRTSGGLSRASRLCFAVAGVLSVLGSHRGTPGGISAWRGSVAWRMSRNLHAVSDLPGLREAYDERWRALVKATALPRSRAAIAGGAVDVVGPAQGLVFTNGLRYRPRPVFQSWAAYSGELNRINERFFLSTARPGFVLQQLVTIDRRLPSQDDSRVLPLLLRDYEWVHEESGQLLWRRKGSRDERPALRMSLIRETSAAFGERVPLGDLADHDLWVQLDYRPGLLGRVRGALYKLPSAWITVFVDGEEPRAFRLLRLVAGDGFLLSPLARDAAEWESLVTRSVRIRPDAFAVSLRDGGERYFEPEIRVRISSVELASP